MLFCRIYMNVYICMNDSYIFALQIISLREKHTCESAYVYFLSKGKKIWRKSCNSSQRA